MSQPGDTRTAPLSALPAELQLSVQEQVTSWQQGELSASDLAERYIEQILRTEPELGAYQYFDPEKVRAAAKAKDEERKNGGGARALSAIPYGLKDIFVTKGMATTCGSKMLAEWIPPYDGWHHERLREAGALLLGKQGMDEFAMGSSNENTPYKVVGNPWDLRRVPGGSSGGSAASVAARSCSFALGSDTGGSIRQPAAFCGIVGLKPSYGRVSRHGMIAYASSLDQAGALTTRVRDAALVLGAIAGHDPKDAMCWDQDPPDFLGACEAGIAGKRIGVHRPALEREGFDPQLRATFLENLKQLEALGASIVDIDLPHFEYSVATYYVIATAEAGSNLARFDGVRYGHRAEAGDLEGLYRKSRGEGFGAEVKRRILLGAFVLRSDSYDEYFGRALKVRTLIVRDYQKAFAHCDVIASPPSPVLPFLRGEKSKDPLAMYLADIFTVGINLAGLPAMSVPSGLLSVDGTALPVGLQLCAARGDEASILAVAAAYEDAHPFYQQAVPPIAVASSKEPA